MPKDDEGGSLVLNTLRPNSTLLQPSFSTSKTKLTELLIEDEERTERDVIISNTVAPQHLTNTNAKPTNAPKETSPPKRNESKTKIIPPLNLYYTPSQPEFDEKPISPPKPQQQNQQQSGNLTNSGNVNNNNNNLTNSANKQSPSVK